MSLAPELLAMKQIMRSLKFYQIPRTQTSNPSQKTETVSIDSIQVLRMSTGVVHEKLKTDTTEIPKKCPEKQSPLPFDPSMFMKEASTIWTDSKVTSFAVDGKSCHERSAHAGGLN